MMKDRYRELAIRLVLEEIKKGNEANVSKLVMQLPKEDVIEIIKILVQE